MLKNVAVFRLVFSTPSYDAKKVAVDSRRIPDAPAEPEVEPIEEPFNPKIIPLNEVQLVYTVCSNVRVMFSCH